MSKKVYLCNDCGILFAVDIEPNRSVSMCTHCGSKRIQEVDIQEPSYPELYGTEGEWTTKS